MEENHTAIVKQSNNQLITHTTDSLKAMLEEAQTYIDSGLLPTHIKTAATAVIIMQYGRELNIGPVQALSNIYVVSGRPSLSGNLLSALVRNGGVEWQTVKDFEPVLDANGQKVDYITSIKFIRNGIEEIVPYTWSEAKQAQLTTKDNWQKYPRNMLYWRCFSMGARRIAADLCMGMYLASEMSDVTHGAPVIVDTDDGNITILQDKK